ncbi:NTE family protein [Paucimonas lemoignei]|uniref:NTE family protein n=1 Tax=Paucimonas lemoignei TaxID=29443 RepID=A0A4R3HTT0_PAULE|nr:patatin-like phospholipase family protein [Paucimonas lemoignei]TCS36094.1 NTE family protein [Paucimonas lemoignei]
MPKKTLTLALQGGGSHGAFTWGVLERLLEDERIDIEGISGASAGAMNAVTMAYGWTIGGREGARQALKDFWESVAVSKPFNLQSDAEYTAESLAAHAHPSPGINALLALTRFLSPYQWNPFDINPLRDILAAQVDFERLRKECPLRLFIAATHVGSGTLKLFRTHQLTLDMLLASACLPSLHHAVEIDGEAYWDGGFTANPPLFPLLHQCQARDIMVVLLHSAIATAIPKTVNEIHTRLTEIGFNAAISTELQAIALAQREARRSLFAFGQLERRLRNLHIHSIASRELMGQLPTLSRLNTKAPFLQALRSEGRAQAEAWLKQHFHHIGVRSSFNLAQFLR